MKGGALRSYLGQPTFDGGMDVFVGRLELELATVQLSLDLLQPGLDRRQLAIRQEAGGGEAPGMGDAALDVIGIELDIEV